MRTELLGLPLDQALERLAGEGIQARVEETRAPRRAGGEGEALRVVYASDDGARLTVSGFRDPIAASQQDSR